jgi:tRNA pseudouridine55 synthase
MPQNRPLAQPAPRVAAPRQAIDGVLLLDKPVGLTSNAALQQARRIFGARRAGHTGTLDPFAGGLLPLCFGEATKFAHYQLEADKTYRATMRLGVTTTTGDPEGSVLATRPVLVGEAEIRSVLARFVGEIQQIPPMYSALKHHGRPLYEYARAGIDIERPPRRVWIRALECSACPLPEVTFTVHCSAGTYIRTLAQDIGEALGCGAHLTALTRLASGGFSLENAHTLDALAALPDTRRAGALLPVDALLGHLPAIELDAAGRTAFLHGRRVPVAAAPTPLRRVYDAGHVFLGLGEIDAAGMLIPRRVVDSSAAT